MAENWKTQQLKVWDELGVPKFFHQIGIDYQKKFIDALMQFSGNDPYVEHKWQWLSNSAVKEGVLHLYPLQTKKNELIWEEWFLYDGTLRHHILSQQPLAVSDGTWSGDLLDKDHPKEVLEITWHYYNEKDFSPLAYRVA